MWIAKLQLNNIRGFVDVHSLDLSKNINLFVGQNNAGKSTILSALLSLQRRVLSHFDVTVGTDMGHIILTVRNPGGYIPGLDQSTVNMGVDSIKLIIHRNGSLSSNVFRPSKNETFGNVNEIPNVEPHNAIYPYLSKRKSVNYIEEIREQHSNSVSGSLETLYNKIDRLSDRFFQPAHDEYVAACENIVGFPISAAPTGGGKRAVYTVHNLDNIPLTSMGEGVPNLLGLIVDLCVAENKIFIIEEIENDIHPKQLKALLDLIEKKSEKNQFFISTHSNIVTKYLGSVQDAKVFRVAMKFDEESRLPISSAAEVENEPEARFRLLEELGYEPFDYDQWKAWLFLEESSAEVIIRDFLIPKFAKKLVTQLRTYSARSLSEVAPKFKDFNNLFVFIHREQKYKNRAWVVVDGGQDEAVIIEKMREVYVPSGWNKNNFSQFSEHDFERYYPPRFQQRIEEILKMKNGLEKQTAKKLLLEDVKTWISENPDDARTEFEESAAEVINILKQIQKSLN